MKHIALLLAALLVFSAVASGWVKVENDVAAYLPADSERPQARLRTPTRREPMRSSRRRTAGAT